MKTHDPGLSIGKLYNLKSCKTRGMTLFPRNDALNNLMVEECTAEYMMKMEKKHECVRHLAFQALPHTSVADISQACDRMNEMFTIDDARALCTGLNAVHAQFWPKFMHPAQ
jgi:hypothetical protein